jgi:hypothetical protein
VLPCPKQSVLAEGASTLAYVYNCGSGDFLTSTSREDKKSPASHHETWQSGTHDRTRNTYGCTDHTGVASIDAGASNATIDIRTCEDLEIVLGDERCTNYHLVYRPAPFRNSSREGH